MVCALIVNIAQAVYGKKGSTRKPVGPNDFMPPWYDVTEDEDFVPEAQAVDEMKDMLMTLAGKTKDQQDKNQPMTHSQGNKIPMRTKPPKVPAQ